MNKDRFYQEKMLKSKSEIVFCNWERGSGRIYSIIKKILENKNGRYIYSNGNHNNAYMRKSISNYVKENEIYIEDFLKNNSKDEIKFKDGDFLEIFYMDSFNEMRLYRNINSIFFDEALPNLIDCKYLSNLVSRSVYIFNSKKDIEVIDDCESLNYKKNKILLIIKNLAKTFNNLIKNI